MHSGVIASRMAITCGASPPMATCADRRWPACKAPPRRRNRQCRRWRAGAGEGFSELWGALRVTSEL